MKHKSDPSSLILVLEDVEETRDGIEILLKGDGYRVDPARHEDEAVARATLEHPSLILVGLDGGGETVMATAHRIRERAGLNLAIPVVIFYVVTIAEGAEVEIAPNVFLVRPDNFDQLRNLIHRLLM